MITKLIALLMVMALGTAVLGMVYAANPEQQQAVMVKCCLEGKCVDASKNDCALKMGRVVTGCKDCKPAFDPNK